MPVDTTSVEGWEYGGGKASKSVDSPSSKRLRHPVYPSQHLRSCCPRPPPRPILIPVEYSFKNEVGSGFERAPCERGSGGSQSIWSRELMTAEPNPVVNSVCSVCQSPCSFSETDQSVEVGFGWDGCWGGG